MATMNDGHKRSGIHFDQEFLSYLSSSNQAGVLGHLFASADARFREEVSSDGKIRRISETIEFSAESLFTSLMQIGLPPSVAIKLPFEIIPFLSSVGAIEHDKPLTTADIRIAVVQTLHSLENDGLFSRETISMWSAAYIRRYGNPSNQFVKVIDNGVEVDLNYDYIRRWVLPHLINRILDLPKNADPVSKFGRIFSSTVLASMAQEIIAAVNTLNLYSIRYKTLLNLLQDLVLEPPHPWMVSRQSINKVVEYNLERASHHLARASTPSARKSAALVRQSAEESVRHASAAILAHYGAFLGVGNRYGLLELRRILAVRLSNTKLWEYCNLHNIELDLRALGSSIDALAACVGRIQSALGTSSTDHADEESWRANAIFLLQIAKDLADFDPGRRESGRPRGSVPQIKTCLALDIPFSDFTLQAEERLLDFIKDFLEYPGEISILAKMSGSTKIYIELSKYQVEQLQWALKRGLLAAAKITDVSTGEHQPSQLTVKGETGASRFDVFLCHNSTDEADIRRIGLWLRNRGIIPWLAQWELRPGIPWQRELEAQIESIPCAAVFVGSSGLGPWQSAEMDSYIRQFVAKGCPVIPVVLKSCSQPPKLPAFIGAMTWVDFRKRKPNPYHELHFGIKGVRLSGP